MPIVTRETKGSALTHAEMDNNFNELDQIPNGKTFPKTQNVGIMIDTDAPDYGWHDMHGVGYVDPASLVKPTMEAFQKAEADAIEGDEEVFTKFLD